MASVRMEMVFGTNRIRGDADLRLAPARRCVDSDRAGGLDVVMGGPSTGKVSPPRPGSL
jgi:hypothetical protein